MPPLMTSATRGWCCASPPDITCVSSIQVQAAMFGIVAAPLVNDVPVASSKATIPPPGDTNAAEGPFSARVFTVPAIQLRYVPEEKLGLDSHTTPAGEGGPAIGHLANAPRVKRRVAVAGSTT